MYLLSSVDSGFGGGDMGNDRKLWQALTSMFMGFIANKAAIAPMAERVMSNLIVPQYNLSL